VYRICPECSYERKPSDTTSVNVCPSCGLIFSKWMQQRFEPAKLQGEGFLTIESRAADWLGRLREQLLYVPPKKDMGRFYGRAVLFVLFFIWGWHFILMAIHTNEIGASFMHNVNLVFHEAGHILFMPFGHFMMVLGGSLGQLLMPIIVMIALMVKNHDNFGASIGLWWLGQSLMDLAPYINDARALKLQLLGGGTGMDRPGMHDWENILLDAGLIRHDHLIATWVDALGTGLMLLAFVWGGYILYLQYCNRSDNAFD
jgi:hypothetical protein